MIKIQSPYILIAVLYLKLILPTNYIGRQYHISQQRIDMDGLNEDYLVDSHYSTPTRSWYSNGGATHTISMFYHNKTILQKFTSNVAHQTIVNTMSTVTRQKQKRS
jgi:hypothetical protein